MMRDMIKSSLTDLEVLPNPLQQSSSKEPSKEPSQDSEDSFKEEDTSHEGVPELDQGNPELD